MDIAAKFQQTNLSKTVSITSLDIDTPYNILRAEKTVTKFGPTVILTLTQSQTAAAAAAAAITEKVFLPKRYSTLFTDDDVAAINIQEKPTYHLLYKGTVKNAAVLEIHRSSH